MAVPAAAQENWWITTVASLWVEVVEPEADPAPRGALS
jgi:hypothetical protein